MAEQPIPQRSVYLLRATGYAVFQRMSGRGSSHPIGRTHEHHAK
jgi:hypothetical protein